MAERLNVVPDDLRTAAADHRRIADELAAVPSAHPEMMAALESLGPIFADLREAGRELLDQRTACYRQQAAAHSDLADRLSHAAQVWEQQDAEAAAELRDPTGGGP